MKITRILAWVFEAIAGALTIFSFWITFEIFKGSFHAFTGHTPGGAPNNGAAGVGLAIALGIGLLAAIMSLIIAHVASPTDEKDILARIGKFIRRSAVIAFCAPIVLGVFEHLAE